MADERIHDVRFDDHSVILELMDGRSIATPLAWFRRLLHATAEQRSEWKSCAAGYGIHWPQLDEDLSTEGLLRGATATKPIYT